GLGGGLRHGSHLLRALTKRGDRLIRDACPLSLESVRKGVWNLGSRASGTAVCLVLGFQTPFRTDSRSSDRLRAMIRGGRGRRQREARSTCHPAKVVSNAAGRFCYLFVGP